VTSQTGGCAQKIASPRFWAQPFPSYSGQEPPGSKPVLRLNLRNEREAHRRLTDSSIVLGLACA